MMRSPIRIQLSAMIIALSAGNFAISDIEFSSTSGADSFFTVTCDDLLSTTQIFDCNNFFVFFARNWVIVDNQLILGGKVNL